MNSYLNNSLSEIRELVESMGAEDVHPDDHKAVASHHAKKMAHHQNMLDHAKHMAHQSEVLGHVDALDSWHARQDHHQKQLDDHTAEWEKHHQHVHKERLQGVVQKAMDLLGKVKALHHASKPA